MLYGCFVDYAKAFDSVCREALLFKLWELEVKGRYSICLKLWNRFGSVQLNNSVQLNHFLLCVKLSVQLNTFFLCVKFNCLLSLLDIDNSSAAVTVTVL